MSGVAATAVANPAASDTSWARIVDFAAARRPVLQPLVALILIASFFLWCPIDAWWVWVFRGARLYLWWPLLLFSSLALFPLAGWRRHNRTGDLLYFPVSASIVACIAAVVLDVVVTFWAADRPLAWCLCVAAIAFAGFCALSAGRICFAQSWRIRCNDAVVASVRRDLQTGWFAGLLQGQWRPKWGSPHCLLVVDGHYGDAKSRLTPGMRDPATLRTAFDAGWLLHQYLTLSWPDSALRVLHARRAELVLELAVICRIGFDLDPGRFREPLARVSADLSGLPQELGEGYRAHIEFVSFALGLQPGGDERTAVARAIDLFGRIPRNEVLPSGRLQSECARNVWMALAPLAKLEEQAVLDVWNEMHEGSESLTKVRLVTTYPDPGATRAQHNLALLYANWAQRTTAPWNAALGRQAQDAASAATAVTWARSDIWNSVRVNTRRTPSWPYRSVWRAASVRGLVVAQAAPFAICCVIALAAAAPAMIGNGGWNTVDAIADNNPLENYRNEDLRGMAGSGSALALATDRGLTLFDKASRVMNRSRYGGGVLSVIAGPHRDGDFIFLTGGQGIGEVRPGFPARVGFWLPPPAHPLWPGPATVDPKLILANQLDDNGWLLAVSNRGLARYTFETRDGRSVRARSWQISELSSVDLQQAILTSSGAWLRTDKAVEFANRKTLKPDPRRELRVPTTFIDSAADGSWATGLDPYGVTYLYSAASPGGTWSDGYFRRESTGIASEREVTVAALNGNVALLGSNTALRSYDIRNRFLKVIWPNAAVRDLVHADGFVLVASSNGLLRVSGAVSVLEGGSIESLGVSPDGALAIWRRGLAHGADIRDLRLRDAKPEAVTLFPETAWKSPISQPEMLAVSQISPSLSLFVTSEGSFFYDHQARTYVDCSESVLQLPDSAEKKQEQTRRLQVFSGVEQEGKSILSIADGTPQLITPGDKRWTSLDPQGETKPVQLTTAGAKVFGAGSNGEIYRYLPDRKAYLTAASQTLKSFPPRTNDFTGDLLRAGQGFVVALLHHGRTAIYDSSTGQFSDEEQAVPESEIAQVRLTGTGQILYLSKDGQVKDSRFKTLFGAGAAPFRFTEATAIAASSDGTSVLVGGPDGQVGGYNYAKGEWSVISAGARGIGAVTGLQESPSGVLASLSTGEYRFLSPQGTVSITGYRRVVSSAGTLFGLDDTGINVSAADSGSRNGLRARKRLADTPGMKSFVAESVFAWRNTRNTIAFFHSSGKVGQYDAEGDVWSEFEGSYGRPAEFQYGADRLFVAYDSGYVVQFLSDLKAEVLHLPRGQSSRVRIRAIGSELRAAYTLGGRLFVEEWDSRGKSAGAIPPWGGEAPGTFDPAGTIYAEIDSNNLRLLDKSGNFVLYNPRTAAWEGLRLSAAGGSVTGLRLEGKKLTGFRIDRSGRPAEFIAMEKSDPAPPAKLTPPPPEGTLYETKGVRITRQGAVTSFTINGVRFTPRGSGFEEQSLDDARLDVEGNVWGVRRGTLIPFDRIGGFFRSPALVIGSRPTPSSFPEATPSGQLAAVPMGGLELRATRGRQGLVALDWNDRSLTVWGKCGKPAFHCIHDIAASQDGDLLISTDLGLVVRSGPDNALRQILPSLAGASFLRTARRLFVATPRNGVREWRSGSVANERATSQEMVDSLDSGLWRWTFADNRLRIAGTNGEQREMTGSGAAWKFSDDYVRWISRSSKGLCLTMTSGNTAFGMQTGRGEACGPAGRDEESASAPLLDILYKSGRVILKPLDRSGRPAIEHGKMFFDTAVQLTGTDDALYSFIPGRAIFRRQMENPAGLLNGWPTSMEEATLERAEGGIRLRSTEGTGERLDVTTGLWKHEERSGDDRRLASALVEWRASIGRHPRFRPTMSIGSKQVVTHWWDGDRFSWDKVNAVGALSGDIVVLGTAAGPIVARLRDKRDLDYLAWTQSGPVIRAATGRQGGVVKGVAVLAGDSEYLVTQQGDQVRITGPLTGQSLFERAVLSVGFHGAGGSFGVVQTWEPSPGPVLRNDTNLTPLFSNGQFSFDGATAAAPAPQGGWWISAPSSLLTRNELVDGVLALREIVKSPCSFSRLRTSTGLVGLCDGTRAIWALRGGVWAETPVDSVRGDFQLGDTVKFDAAKLDWEVTGRHDPWSAGSFSADLSRPLFWSDGTGVALAHDVFTSVALSDDAENLAIGTRGGLLWWALGAGSSRLFQRGVAPLQIPASGAEVMRIRKCSNGTLWASSAAGQIFSIDKGGLAGSEGLAAWPEVCVSDGEYQVHLNGRGSVTAPGGVQIDQSSNAWGIGRQPLSDILDYHSDEDAVWLATRSAGIVKLFRHPPRGFP